MINLLSDLLYVQEVLIHSIVLNNNIKWVKAFWTGSTLFFDLKMVLIKNEKKGYDDYFVRFWESLNITGSEL